MITKENKNRTWPKLFILLVCLPTVCSLLTLPRGIRLPLLASAWLLRVCVGLIGRGKLDKETLILVLCFSSCLLGFFALQPVFLLFWPVILAVTYSFRNNFAIFLPPLFGFCFVGSEKEPSPAPNKLRDEEIASGWCNFLDLIPWLRLWDRGKRGFGLWFMLVGLSVTECFFPCSSLQACSFIPFFPTCGRSY